MSNGICNQLKLLFWKKNAMPVYLVHFITDICFLKCKHCFVNKVKAKDELTLEEIDRLTRNLGSNLYSVLLTGGEPFQRKDIDEIIRLYYRNAGVKSIQIPTNGYFKDRVVQLTETICTEFPDRTFVISISFDGVGARHDEIRGMNGIFDKAVDTFKELKLLETRIPNFNLSTNITFSYFNQDNILDIYNYILDELKGTKITITLARDRAEDMQALQVDIEKYKHFIDLVRKDVKKGRLKGYDGFGLNKLVNAQDVVTRERNYITVKHNKFISDCYAAHLNGVICSNGDIHDCEIKRRNMGNLRQHDFDLHKIWLKEESEMLKNSIKEGKCFCTHECPNITNILYNPKTLSKVLLEVVNEQFGL